MAGAAAGLEMMVVGMGLSPEGAEGVVGVALVGAAAAEAAEGALQEYPTGEELTGEEAGGGVLVAAGLVAEAAVGDIKEGGNLEIVVAASKADGMQRIGYVRGCSSLSSICNKQDATYGLLWTWNGLSSQGQLLKQIMQTPKLPVPWHHRPCMPFFAAGTN